MVDIVIVNWNAGRLLDACLASIEATAGPALSRVMVVDNASTDGSALGLGERHALPLTVIANPENRGFGAACNQGAKSGQADSILFLNPDTRLHPGTIAGALAFMADHPEAGISGVRLMDEAGVTQRSCARFPTPWAMIGQAIGLDRFLPAFCPPHFLVEWDHLDTRPVDQVIGAFLLIRRSLFETLGGFDERFFVYYEDLDLCLRARQAGWQVIHNAGVTATHIGGGTTRRIKVRRLVHAARSRIRYAGKHFSPGAALAVAAAAFVLEPVSRIALGLARGMRMAR